MLKLIQRAPAKARLGWKTVLILLAVFCLSLQGCGNSSDDAATNDSATTTDDFEEHPLVSGSSKSATISGTVTGGLVDNALVVVLGAIADNSPPDRLLAAGYTDNGSYRINIPAEYSGAIEILVKADNKFSSVATMICDAWPGCGNAPWPGLYDSNQNGEVDFGEKFTLPENFEMRAISFAEPDAAGINISVTPMSSLAAAYVKNIVQGFDQISVGLANARIANLLGMKIDFVTKPAADITVGLAALDYEQLIYGIWSGAFLALVDDVNRVDVVFQQLEENFIFNDGQWLLFSGNNDAFTLAKLLQEALLITEALIDQNNQLAEFKNYLLSQLALAMASEGEYSDVESSPGAGLTAEAQVSLFLDDLVSLGALLNLSDVETFGFADQIALAHESMLSDATVSALAATGKYALALSLIPDIASNEDVLPYLCTFVSGVAGTVCTNLAETYTLEEICEGNITFLGINFCALLEPYLTIEIPSLEEGLTVTFNVLTRDVVVVGELNDQQVDLLFTVPDFYQGENIFAEVSGSIANAYDTFNVQGQFEINLTADQVFLDEIMNFSIDSGKLAGYLVLASSSASGAGSSATISFGTVSTYTVGFVSMLDDGEAAQVVVMGELVDFTPMPDSTSMEYSGRMLNISTTTEGSILNAFNQDGIETEFYMDLVGDGKLGAIYLDNVLYADVMREMDVVSAIALSGDVVDLSEIFQ